MRQFALTFTVALVSLVTSGSALALDDIQWAEDLDRARLAASQQNKLLLIHFWTPDCGPCKVVDKKVFPTPIVAQAVNQHYIPLKVNAYQNAELRNHFGVRQWPTDIVATVDGKALHRMVTPQDPSRYVSKLMQVASQHSPASRVEGPQSTVLAQAGSQLQPPTHNSLSQAGPSPSSQSQNVQASFPQQQPNPQTKWAGNIQSPQISSSNIMARRPGVDPAMRPGSGTHMQTPKGNSQLGSTSYGQLPNVANGQAPSRYDNLAKTGPANVVPQAKPAEISNRFSSANQMTPPNSSGTKLPSAAPANAVASNAINNPYFKNSPSTLQNQPRVASSPGPQPAPTQPSVAMQQAPQFQQPQFQQPKFQQPPSQQPQFQQPTSQPAFASRFDQPTPGLQNKQPVTPPNAIAQAPAQTALGQQPQRQPVTPIQSGSAPIGLEGRCPVTLVVKNKWKPGDKRWGAVHRGKTYLFAGPEEQQRFLANPDNYSPVLAGMDVVRLAANGRIVEGTRRYGVLFDDDGSGPRESRIYLFDSVDSRNRFEAEPGKYLRPVMAAQQSGSLEQLLR